jgi:hypothetical protein
MAIFATTMNSLLAKCFRSAVLAMMILLSGMASMVCFSYDADGNEATPPVTIEFNGIVPSKKSIHSPKQNPTTTAQQVRDEEPASVSLLASIEFSSTPILDKDSSQLLVPLRR